MHISLQNALKRLNPEKNQLFEMLFQKSGVEVEIYKPHLVDKQTPHDRDEIYFVASGHSMFVNDKKTYPVQAGDFIFVPKKIEHRFFDFSADFSTWVLFFE